MWLTQERSHDAARRTRLGLRRGKVRVTGMRKPFLAANWCLFSGSLLTAVCGYKNINVLVHFHSAAKAMPFHCYETLKQAANDMSTNLMGYKALLARSQVLLSAVS